MRLSRKPSAIRRRRVFFAIIALILVGAAATVVLRLPDPARRYVVGLGFSPTDKPERTKLKLPADLTQAPYDSYLSASKAAGHDFAAFAGKEVTSVAFCIGRLSGTEQQVFLHVYLSGKKVVGAFLVGAEAGETASPVNSPTLTIEPLS